MLAHGSRRPRLVLAHEARIADDVDGEDRGEAVGAGHPGSPASERLGQARLTKDRVRGASAGNPDRHGRNSVPTRGCARVSWLPRPCRSNTQPAFVRRSDKGRSNCGAIHAASSAASRNATTWMKMEFRGHAWVVVRREVERHARDLGDQAGERLVVGRSGDVVAMPAPDLRVLVPYGRDGEDDRLAHGYEHAIAASAPSVTLRQGSICGGDLSPASLPRSEPSPPRTPVHLVPGTNTAPHKGGGDALRKLCSFFNRFPWPNAAAPLPLQRMRLACAKKDSRPRERRKRERLEIL